jgi:Leucine-rich repeat (LRR) protein
MNWRVLLLLPFLLSMGGVGSHAASYALLVGVSEYSDPSIVDLEYAASDAREMALALETDCGFLRPDILLLTEGEATRDGLVAGFAWLRERVGPSDLAFIYFAGHGSTVVDREGDEADGDGMDECILPQDAVLLDPSTYVTDDELGTWIAELGSGAVSLFLDSCYSGGQSRMAGTATREIADYDSVARDVMTAGLGGPIRGVLAACSPSQLALENPILGHGVFTHFLLRGLQEDGVDRGDDVLSMSELSDYVIRGVSEWSEQANEFQTPVLDMPPGMDIPIIAGVSAARLDGPPLVAYFPFDSDFNEAAGGFGTVNHGGELVSGVVGNAARFNNQPTDLCYVRALGAYEPLGGAFAVSLWFRSERVKDNPGALFSSHARYNDYGPEYSAWIGSDGALMFQTDDTRGVNRRQTLSTTTYRWDDGVWHHLVVQRLPDGWKEIWIDGRLEAREWYSIQDIRTAANPFTVGGSAYAGWSYVRSFTGDIDELRIYSGALDSRRISNLVAMGVPDEPVFVPDSVVADAIRSALGLPDRAGFTRLDLLRVRTLEIHADRDVDPTGITFCRDLRSLRLSGGGISDLSFVRELPGLVELTLPRNRIERLDALQDLTSIERLDLSSNAISDISALSSIPNLYRLDLSSNAVADLSPLAGLSRMKELYLRGNAIADLGPLRRLSKLWYLDLGGNRVTNLLPLVGLPKLTVLSVAANGILDIGALAQMPELEEIDLSWNQIVDVSPLVGLEWLGDYTMFAPGERTEATLNLAGNPIVDPSPLLACTGLGAGDSVDVSWNPFTAILADDVARIVALLAERGVVVLMN